MTSSSEELIREVKQVFPGTMNVNLAQESAESILKALSGLVKIHKGKRVSAKKLYRNMVDTVAEGLMAYYRLERKTEHTS